MTDPHAGPPAPQIVPIPADFPVSWDNPEDERLPWQFDPMHFPEPMPRLEGELYSAIYETGMSPAFAGYELPVRARGTMFNDYHYMAIFPVIPPEEMEAQGEKAEKAVGAAMARLQELWEGEWLPAIQGHLAFWEGFDLQGASAEDFLAHYDETLERLPQLWDLHFKIVVPAYMAMGLYDCLLYTSDAADDLL